MDGVDITECVHADTYTVLHAQLTYSCCNSRSSVAATARISGCFGQHAALGKQGLHNISLNLVSLTCRPGPQQQ